MNSQSSNLSLLCSEETANYLFNNVSDLTTLLTQDGDPFFALSQSESIAYDMAPSQYTAVVEQVDNLPDHELHIQTTSYVVEPPGGNIRPSTAYQDIFSPSSDYPAEPGANYSQFASQIYHNADNDFNNNFRQDLRFDDGGSMAQPYSPIPRASVPNAITGNFSRDVPCNTAYPGPYGFKIFYKELSEGSISKKAISYTYSESCNKLFAKLKENCPVNFKLTKRPPPGTFIRVMAVFSSPQDVLELVKRCANHASADQGQHVAPTHFVRCVDSRAVYEEDKSTGRHSVVVPYEPPASGDLACYTILYQFMCYSSCPGTINRRPIQLIFTLEHDGRAIGRQVTEVRICACPGRDKQNEEQLNAEYRNKKKCKRVNKITTMTAVEPIPKQPQKVERNVGEDDSSDPCYTIQIKDRQLYKLVLTIVRNYELAKRFEELNGEVDKSDAALSQGPSSSQNNERQTKNLGLALSQEKRFDGSTLIETWLDALGLPDYSTKFKEAGYVRLEQLEFVNVETLRSLAFNEADFEKLHSSLSRWRLVKNFPSQLSSLGTPPTPAKKLKISRTTVTHSYKI